MLEIDREVDDERPAPSVAEAELARDAAKDVLQELPKERERLSAQIAECVSLGDFDGARAARDALALAEDRAAFAQGQVARADLVLLGNALAEAERAALAAADALTLAFASEEQARQSHQQATAARCGAQARMQGCSMRIDELRRAHGEARRKLEGQSP